MTPQSDYSASLLRPPRPSQGLLLGGTIFIILALGFAAVLAYQIVDNAPINSTVSLLWIATAIALSLLLYRGVFRARHVAAKVGGNLLMVAAGASLLTMLASLTSTNHHRNAPWVQQFMSFALVGHGLLTLFLFFYATQMRDWAKELNDYERRKPNCHRCQYDLRGSLAAGSSSCPECGAPIRDEKVNAHAAAMKAHAGERS